MEMSKSNGTSLNSTWKFFIYSFIIGHFIFLSSMIRKGIISQNKKRNVYFSNVITNFKNISYLEDNFFSHEKCDVFLASLNKKNKNKKKS